ncbi:MAG: hypothetical protein HOO91_20760 [Bacteroidales bacterium]|nr:hypothetical protein [Bacteroidales bacterium]
MKKYLTLFLVFYAFTSYSQTILFKDNLFDNSRKWIEVIDEGEYRMLKFESADTDTAKIYQWKYELLVDAFKKHYKSIKNQDSIRTEAFRVFFAIQKQVILKGVSQNQLIAGTMGFDNDHVFLKKVDWDFKEIYKDNLNDALNLYKKAETEVQYKNFIVKSKDLIVDRLINKDASYPKNYLEKYGPTNFKEHLDKKITETFLFFLDSMDKALIQFDKLSDKISKLGKDSIKINNEIFTLEKNTFIVNDLGVRLQSKIQELEKETNTEEFSKLKQEFIDSKQQACPFQQIPDSLFKGRFAQVIIYKQLCVLREKEKINVDELLDKINSNNQNRNTLESIQNDLLQANIVQKKLLQEKLKRFNKYLSNNRGKIKETIKKIQTIKDSALVEYGYEILNMKIDTIDVEINQTFVDKIVAYGIIEYYGFQKNNKIEKNQMYITLRNKVPIGISSLNSIDRNNKKIKLYASINGDEYEVELYKVMAFYRPKLKNGRRDLSPADTSFTIVKNKGIQNVVLYKSPSQKLFEFRVFSDIKGINGTNPNGLIQTEFSKEMYLNPYKYTFCKRPKEGSAYYGFLDYISPNVLISKFEKTNKYLPIIKIGDTSNVSTLNLKKYEIYSVGFDLNLFMTSVPSLKTIFYFDSGINYSGIGVSDSTLNLEDSIITINDRVLNSISFKLNTRFNIQTDESYFLELRGGLQYIKLLNDKMNQLASLEKMGLENSWRNKTLYNIEFFGGYSPTSNSKGKLFFRYRYYGSFAKKVYEGYSQIQIGYSYYFDK